VKGEINLCQDERSYAKEIYKQIKLDILNLRIKDGDFLTLAELADKYNVSKTPVRDALGALEIQGYLKSLPRKGYLVKPVTQKNIRESFQMRAIFEKAAVSIAVKSARDLELEAIMELAMKFPKDSQNNKIEEFNELNHAFHMSIIKAANNSQLIEMSEGIMENLSRILRIDCNDIEFENEREEHINIAKALIERDSKKAERLVLEHISDLQTRVYSNERIGLIR
jgi:Transcriptional regulators